MVEVLSERVFSEVAPTTPHPVNFRFVFYIFLFLRLETSISVFLWVYMHKRCDRAVVLLVWKEF